MDTVPVVDEHGFSEVLDTREAAKFLRMSPRWVWTALRENKIPHSRLGARPRMLKSDLKRWLEMGCPSADAYRDMLRSKKNV